MGKNKKNKIEVPNNDAYNVKASFKKLNNGNSSNQRNAYLNSSTTDDDYLHTDSNEDFLSSKQDLNDNSSFEIASLKQYQKITSDLSQLKDSLNAQMNQSSDTIKKDYEDKLKEKVDHKLFYGAVAAILLFGTIIYVLSYQPLSHKIENISNDHLIIKDSLKNIRFDLKNKK